MRHRISQFLVPAVALAGALGSGAWLVTQETPAWASPIPWATFSAQDGENWTGPGPEMMGAAGTGMMGGSNGTGMGGTGMGGNGTGTGMMSAVETGMMGGSNGTGMIGTDGTGMMGWVGGNGGPVADLDGAREQAAGFARFLGGDLRVGEVMRFSNHYYAQILDPGGSRVTEVLVDPGTGGVQMELGPAMMWNSRYGMAAAGSGTPEVSAEEALAAAQRALSGDGTTVGPAEEFPGYYTLHTLQDGEVAGMVSVDAVTGAVWSHGWHGRFVEMSEAG